MKDILLRKSDELTGACRNYLENIKEYLDKEGTKAFSNREIRKALRVNPSNQKRYNLSLIANYYIRKVKGKKGQAYQYEIVSPQEFKRLSSHIDKVLEQNLERCNQFTGSLLVH